MTNLTFYSYKVLALSNERQIVSIVLMISKEVNFVPLHIDKLPHL